MAEISLVVQAESEETLGICLNALMGQTLRDIEIVLLCGENTQASRICRQYALLDERMLICCNEGGENNLRNVVCDVIKGDLVYIIRSNIVTEEKFCKKIVNAFKKQPCDTLVFAAQKLYKNGPGLCFGEKRVERDEEMPKLLENGAVVESVPELYLQKEWSPLLYNKVFRKALLQENLDKCTQAEDGWEEMLVLGCLKQSKKVLFEPAIVCGEAVDKEAGAEYEPNLLLKSWRLCEEMERIVAEKHAYEERVARRLKKLRAVYVWRGMLMLWHPGCPLAEEEKLDFSQPILQLPATLEAFDACAGEKQEYAHMAKLLRKRQYKGALFFAEDMCLMKQGKAGVLNKVLAAGVKGVQRLARQDSALFHRARMFQRRLQTVGIRGIIS